MAATFVWGEANGAGQTLTNNVTNVNWKAVDDVATAFSAAPIPTGTNSYEKWQYGHFSGSYNQILNLKFAHTAGVADTGITLKGQPAMTADGDRLTYTTPSTAANAALTFNDTAVVAIGSGRAVWVGPTSANASGKAASTTANPAFTNYITTQNQVGGSAAPGDMTALTVTLQWDEN